MLASIVGPVGAIGCTEGAQQRKIGSQGMSLDLEVLQETFLCTYSAPYSPYRSYNRS